MNTWDKCKNCGGDYGIHHYQTNQCPVGGREAPVNRKQEYKTTTFEKEDDSTQTITKLIAALQEIDNLLTGSLPITQQVKKICKDALKEVTK